MDKKWIPWLIIGILVFLLLRNNTVQNEESWEWVNYKGNKRSITVHRNVKAN